MTADLKVSKHVIDTFKKLIYNRRHLKLNIIITVQSFVNIPLDVRKNISNLILFKPSKKEFQLIFDELVEKFEERFQTIFNFCKSSMFESQVLNSFNLKMTNKV